jgi:hypothetical protein
MRIDPKHLMIIAEISDAGGFTEAASSLGTSQPAISRVVKMLEQRLGEPIFHRVRKPLQLTSADCAVEGDDRESGHEDRPSASALHRPPAARFRAG